MWCFVLGCAGFLLFFLYDVLQMKAPKWAHGALFFLGLACLAVGTGGLLLAAPRAGALLLTARGIAALAAGLLFFWLLLHSLFFSLPKETYRDASGRRPLVDTGLYALCRHPGVLFFTALYACLWLAFGGGLLLLSAAAYSALNLLYGLMQDVWVFPRQFAGYADYRRRTPFLIPNGNSVRACMRTWRFGVRAEW